MLGAIADDITGAVDLASNLVSRGLRTRLHFGVSTDLVGTPDADAVVMALKSRTAPVADAVRESEAALDALLAAGADRIYVKYCSTFDSTPRGNIGPVCDAVIERLGAGLAVVVPSFPDNGRTLYRHHLFVGDVPLHESSLAQHPLTPMTDADIVRVLQRQTPSHVDSVSLETVREGASAVRAALAALEAAGTRYAVVDAITNGDLSIIADAVADARVVTGGSGLALGMPARPGHAAAAAPAGTTEGARVVLAGSASRATDAQLAHAIEAGTPIIRLSLDDLAASTVRALAAADQLMRAAPEATIIVAPEGVGSPIDATSGEGARRAAALEAAFGQLARGFVDHGVRRLIVAGGETSGAVVSALGIDDLVLGETISPGVAWTFTPVNTADGPTPIALALKSGNFGRTDIFLEAWSLLA